MQRQPHEDRLEDTREDRLTTALEQLLVYDR
jgi:hypothetical protein